MAVSTGWKQAVLALRRALSPVRRELAAFIPALGLGALWFGVEGVLLVALTALAVAWLARPAPVGEGDAQARDAATDLVLREGVIAALDAALAGTAPRGRQTGCLVVGLEDSALLRRLHGDAGYRQILRRTAERLHGALREADVVARLDEDRFAVALMPTRRTDLETMVQIAARLQAAIEAPLSLDRTMVEVGSHLGFCLQKRAPEPGGAALLMAAEVAAAEAAEAGPGAIRAYTVEIQALRAQRGELADAAAEALETGRIRAAFQPQISTETGDVTGFCLVAEWRHPAHGTLPEAEILPLLAAAGLHSRLSEMMLHHGFSALRAWARSDAGVGRITLAVDMQDLHDPRFAERIGWELDRFGAAPDALGLVVPEAALNAPADGVVAHTLAALGRIGCRIELAGLAGGGETLAGLCRAPVARLRIDRSLTAGVDAEPEQKRLVSAVLSLAERLRVETLACEVETLEELSALAQLGCAEIQGPAVAMPMGFDETQEWIRRHRVKLGKLLAPGRKIR